jgi:sugar phosphate isomerase/epimerase
MEPRIALQLYSVRESAQKDFEGTVRRVAAMGYSGVEPAGFPGTTAQRAGKLFAELDLAVPSAHMPIPLGETQSETLEAMAAIGCGTLITGKGPDAFATVDEIRRTCDLFNEAASVCRANGLGFGIHNHWWEFTLTDGVYPYKVMLECLDPSILFQIDTYWVQTAGADVVEVVRELAPRAPLLHIKDGPCVKTEPMTAVGDGVMDFPTIVAAAGNYVDWLIVELDRCATDMIDAVARSYGYLAGAGLGR